MAILEELPVEPPTAQSSSSFIEELPEELSLVANGVSSIDGEGGGGYVCAESVIGLDGDGTMLSDADR